jgi:hydroxyacylglutathione hydrolase
MVEGLIDMKYEIVVVGALDTNCYLVYDGESRECAIVDPGAEPAKIIAAVADLELKPVMILNTHGHLDHTGANSDIKAKYRVPLSIHAADAPMLEAASDIEKSLMLDAHHSPPPDRLFAEGVEVLVGGVALRVLHLPGHTPGSVGLLAGKVLFSGDTLFCGGVGRTDLPGGSRKDLQSSIRDKILPLPGETLVLPGHGPWTTVEEEKVSNPFFT